MRTGLLPILISVSALFFLGGGCPRDSGVAELAQNSSIKEPGEVAKTPIIFEGLVIDDGTPFGHARNSLVDGRPVQLLKGRVRVENVLQGVVNEQEVDVFFYLGSIPGSSRSIRLNKGERNIFFLRREGKKLRTNNDRSANGCLLLVNTGPHPNFKREPGSSINQTIMDLFLTRGSGVDDRQMIAAIEKSSYTRFASEEQVVKTLERMQKTETPLVKEAACQELLSLNHGCGQEMEAPAVTIQNVTRPRSSGTFELGDRIRTNLHGQANQVVYRSSSGRVGVTDANGRFTFTETIDHLPRRTRTDVWLVGAEELSPAVSYMAGRRGDEGTIITTAIGKPRDRYGMGFSALSVTGGTVLTYSAILLDYRTGLYYDAREVDTLYEENKPIKTGSASGSVYAQQFWETKVTFGHDYLLQGGHYAVAALQAKAFANPLGFAQGSCFGMTSNCQIVRLDGPVNVAKAAIFLGNTGGDQSAVFQDPDWLLKNLDPAGKAAVLDSLLPPMAAGSDDAYMIGMINEVVRQPSFGNDLVVKKLQQVADRDTAAVRAKACRELRKLHHPCGKRSGPAPVRQKAKPALEAPIKVNGLQTAIPRHMVFTNFFLMIHGMEEKKLISAFRLKWLSRRQLDALKEGASALTRELANMDVRAQKVTVAFRHSAQLRLRDGEPLPRVPDEICRLQAMRTAAMVDQTVSWQTILGPTHELNFEAMLAYQFARADRLDWILRGGGR